MGLPGFEYFEPTTIEEACSLLQAQRGKTKVMAGGTDLIVRMKQKLITSCSLINLKRIPGLNRISENGEEVRIGSLTSLDEIEKSPVIRREFPLLSRAAGFVGSPQVRSMGTIGGNICLETRCWYYNQSSSWRKVRPPCFKTGGDRCHVIQKGKHCSALFLADTVPALIVLGARVIIASSGKERVIDIEKLYTGAGERPLSLAQEEMVTGVRLEKQPPRTSGAYLKCALREGINFAVVSVAARVTLHSDSESCRDARITVGGVSSAPKRLRKAEEVMKREKVTGTLLDEAAEVALKEVGPIVHIETPAAYRKEMVSTLTRQVIKDAFARARQEVRHG